MRTREFRIEDYLAVRESWQAAELELRPGDDLEDIKLKLERDSDLFLVTKHDGRIVGSVIGGWDGRRGGIYHLALSPDYRRQGIGARLVGQLEERLVAKGAKIVNAQIPQTEHKIIHRLQSDKKRRTTTLDHDRKAVEKIRGEQDFRRPGVSSRSEIDSLCQFHSKSFRL